MPPPVLRRDDENINQGYVDDANQALWRDPEWQALYDPQKKQSEFRPHGGSAKDMAHIAANKQMRETIMQKYGVTIPEGYDLTDMGALQKDRTFWQRYGGTIMAAAAIVTAGAATAAMAGAAPAAVGGTTAATTTAAPVAAGTTAAATGGGTALTTAATTGGGGWLTKYAVNKGLEVGGNLITRKIQGDADAKAAEARKAGYGTAAAEQKAIYDQTRGDLAPYRNVGGAAMSTLGALMGLGGGGGAYVAPNAPLNQPAPGAPAPEPTNTRTRPPDVPIGGYAQPRTPTLGDVNPARARTESSMAPGSMVTIQAPDGERQSVPAVHKDFYVKQGGTVVA